MTPGLIIVCHASPAWGFGHLHRSLAMATIAREQGWRVYLVTRGPRNLIDARVPLSFTTCGVPQEAPITNEFECLRLASEELSAAGADRLRIVVDHPHVDLGYADGLNTIGIPWLTFSQSTRPPGPPDWVVSPLTADELDVEEEWADTHWLRGPAYAVLRPIFRKGCPHGFRSLRKCRRLMVTFGGGSDFGASERLLPPILEAFPELEIELITTRSNENLSRIEAEVDHYGGRLMLTLEPEEIAVRMCAAGAAVTAGGTTTVELAALGVPFITVAIVENQELPSIAWENRGVSLHAGNLECEVLVERVLAHIRHILDRPDKCLERSHRAVDCVDGLGAHRILKHLVEEV